MRYAEALGITVKDFDFVNYTLTIDKTWNYKARVGEFQPTKNDSSMREIEIDPITAETISSLDKDLDPNKPIFVQDSKKKICFHS